MRYPEHLVEQVRHSSDIVEIVGDAVRLKKQGRGLVGLCPFHDDRHPSMHVNPELGLFKCFSCGKGGNVITFMMEFHRLTFQEAVQSLARRTHIVLPDEVETEMQSETRNRRESALRALEAAAKLYVRCLSAPEGAEAARYFAKREFGAKLMEDFALGYAPDAWNIIGEHLRKQGFSDQTLDDAGLLVRRENGKVYDRFRGRAMFAIHDAAGRIAGFGARIIQNAPDGQPKYINSPQSATYDKSRILYGLFQAKQQIRSDGYAILVEGYADALTLHQAGFRNTVASSGTALTKEQLQLLGRYCKQLFIVYDGDAAGAKATVRGLELAVEAGFDVRIVRLPINEDPDSFTRRSGGDAFRGRLHSALTFLDFMIESLRESGGFDTPPVRAESLRTLVGMVAKTPDSLQHDALMLKIADSLHLSSRELHKIYDELSKVRRETARRNETHELQSVQSTAAAPLAEAINANEITVAKADMLPLSNEESAVLRIAITVPKALRYLIEKVDLQPQAMLTERGKRLLVACISAFPNAEDDPIGWLLNSANLTAGDADAIAGLAMKRETPSDKWGDFDVEIAPEDVRRVMTDALLKMRLQKLEGKLAEIKQQLRTHSTEIDEIATLTTVKQLTEERSRIAQSLGSVI
ncbi:hypothetical protein MASR2M18_04720 [Ignavibacteria bacterium]|nr:DNA primase [Bacteroidota bacterium]MCZ2131749.1 DNA primase [Bacteroidota bacterium]